MKGELHIVAEDFLVDEVGVEKVPLRNDEAECQSGDSGDSDCSVTLNSRHRFIGGSSTLVSLQGNVIAISGGFLIFRIVNLVTRG